ncbi:hypothetical protein BDV29DRAFT_41555 [Aspergillus leporis]|jgi:hypothetical protein|uniref:Hydrophobic surface binding protein A-domain-containing protein n=1 Tax=Aspergillus leporis TaxID=41062 RepID=A0A5N5XFD0_9EURO|nr:hypothetical protein BDV29DRAFT_41555 [Aspergillus leporis]
MMHRSLLFCLILLSSIISLIHAHSAVPRSSLDNCQNLERLNRTVHRVSPILERLLHLQTDNGNVAAAAPNATISAPKKRGLGDMIEKIQPVQLLLEQSKNKLSGKMMSCQEPNLNPKGVLETVGGSVVGDGNDKQCTLDEVLDELVDELTDSLECLLLITSSLLDSAVGLVFSLLSGIVQLISELLDLD